MFKKLSKDSFLILILFINVGCVSTPRISWNSVAGPTLKNSEIYGSYSAGCLDGAVSLAASSEDYQVMRISRKRYYGHPRLIQFLNNYANEVNNKGMGVLVIGDLSQARGGPMPGGHSSHQIGLDADIWFKRFSDVERKNLSLDDMDSMPAISMVNHQTKKLNTDTWQEENEMVLKMAALDNRVARIFVNFSIKKALCEKYKSASWLKKVRPWWGHESHYHIRLNCPEHSLACKPQTPVANIDGCDETLEWWFGEEARTAFSQKAKLESKDIILPVQCEAVWRSAGME